MIKDSGPESGPKWSKTYDISKLGEFFFFVHLFSFVQTKKSDSYKEILISGLPYIRISLYEDSLIEGLPDIRISLYKDPLI